MSSSLQPRTDRQRILVLIKGLGIGGAERLIVDGARHWDRGSFDYRVAYVLPWKNQLQAQLESMGVEVVCIGGRRGLTPAVLPRLRGLLTDYVPNLIHAHLPSAGILARVGTRMPVVYTEHNLAHSYSLVTRALNRLTYSRNRAVIAVSDAVAESLRGYSGPPPVVIPNGVDCAVSGDEAAAARAELGLGPGQRLVVHVGNIRPHKGHSNLVAASARLASKRSDFVVISIGGEKQPGDLQRISAEARAAGLESTVRFLGRRSDARAFLAAADVVVNPADVEGLPVAILEALALRRPVVATAVGGVPTVIIDGVTGRLVPPGDPEALAEAISDALESPQASEWGRGGADLVERNHGIGPMVAACEKVYREVLDG